jgi:hypothetical protein
MFDSYDLGIKFVIGATLAATIALFVWGFHIARQPPTITKAGENCVIVEQGGFKEVRCFTNVEVNNNINSTSEDDFEDVLPDMVKIENGE